jgi:two-component system torCAD operon response regulator TorR
MKPKILLLDDDEAIRQMLGRILTQEGYLVIPAATGQRALELAAATELDLALLDLNLPGQNGWDVFERLTADKPLLPVVIITARANQLFVALGAGAGALMEKPLDPPRLLQIIRDLLDEPVEVRLARVAGRRAEFHYLPPNSWEDAESRRGIGEHSDR